MILVMVFCLLSIQTAIPLCGFSQDSEGTVQPTGRFGIFNATADWGIPESPPQIGNYKLPGSIVISASGNDLVYDVYGNGNLSEFFSDIAPNTSDEGYFVYLERSGSWSLSGRVGIIEPSTHINQNPTIGLMIREDAQSTESKYYSINYLNYLWGEVNLVRYAQWRKEHGKPPHYTTPLEVEHVEDAKRRRLNPTTKETKRDEYLLTDFGEFVFFRITRISSLNLAYIEFSKDGEHWDFVHGVPLELPETVAYGIYVSNVLENDYEVHGQATQVHLSPAPPVATRALSSRQFRSGDIIQVQLTIFNDSDTSHDVEIVETLPPNWSASDISGDGRIDNGSIHWNLSVPTGTSTLEYTAKAVESASSVATFEGKVGSIPVFGDSQLTSDLGIFDHVVDWGLPEYLPNKHNSLQKRPGNLIVSASGEETIYDIFGSGTTPNYGYFKEGFFAYTEKKGSWTFQAKVEPVSEEEPVVCILVRDQVDDPNSIFYGLRVDVRENRIYLMDDIRYTRYMGEYSLLFADRIRDFSNPSNKDFYIRITRIESLNLFLSEWSNDGLTWYLGSQKTLEMKESVACGFLVCSNHYTDKVIHARLSNVSFQPAPPMAIRTINPDLYVPGDRLQVNLTVVNDSTAPQPVQITEIPPANWTIEDVSHNGVIAKGKIDWSIEAKPGQTVLAYVLTAPTAVNDHVSFQGNIGEKPLLGESSVGPVLDTIWEDPKPKWRYWTSLDGLEISNDPQNAVLAINSLGHCGIISDSLKGNQNLDGYAIQTIPFYDQQELVHYPLFESLDGQFWTYLYEINQINGLNLFRDNRWTSYRHSGLFLADKSDSKSRNHSMLAIGKDRAIVVMHNSLDEYNMKENNRRTIIFTNETQIGEYNNILPSRDGGAWLSADNGVVKLNWSNSNGSPEYQWSEYVIDEQLKTENDGVTDLWYPMESSTGTMTVRSTSSEFFTDVGSILALDPQNRKWRFLKDNVHKGLMNENSALWTLEDKALKRINRFGHEQVFDEGVFAGDIWDIASDPTGEFWVYTQYGLARNTPPVWRSPPEVAGLHEPVYSIHEDRTGRLWYAGKTHILALQDKQWSIYQLSSNWESSPLPLFYPQLLSLPNSQPVFSGFLYNRHLEDVNHHLVTLNPMERTVSLLDKGFVKGFFEIYQIYPRKEGTILVRTSRNELYEFDGDEFKPFLELNLNLRDEKSFAIPIIESEQGDLWVGVKNKIRVYKNQKPESDSNRREINRTQLSPPTFARDDFETISFSDDDRETIAWCIHEIHPGWIWVGTDNSIFEVKNGTWKKIQTNLGTVYQIITDQHGSQWVAASSGLYRYFENNWQAVGKEENLPFNPTFSIQEDREGTIWVGTAKGIYQYRNDADRDPPDTFIDSGVRKMIQDTEMQITFSGIDRWKVTEENQLLYSYRLNEENWSPYSSQTSFVRDHLPVGDYRFEVRAMDRNWNVDPVPAVLAFTVSYKWYKNPAFLITVGLMLFFLLWSATHHIYHHLNLEKLVAERTESLTSINKVLRTSQQQLKKVTADLSLTEERERRRLASDIHDSVSQSLALSVLEITMLKNSIAPEVNTEKFTTITDLLNQTLKATQSLTFELCPPILYQLGLGAAVRQFIRHLQEQHDIDFLFDEDAQELSLSEDHRHFLFRATRELLLNVVKHAQATTCRVSIKKNIEEIHIHVKDNGVGFEPSASCSYNRLEGGFGLFSLRERLTQMGGELTVESQQEFGSTVTIVFPVKKDAEK